MYQNGKAEAKRLHGVRKPKEDEEMAWAPPRKKSDWPGCEGASKTAESEWRLELEGEADFWQYRVGSGGREETDGGGSWQEEYILAVLVHGGKWP